jgi:hypothetical protein
MNWILVVLVLLVLFYLYQTFIKNDSTSNQSIRNIELVGMYSGEIDPTINGDVSRYTAFPDKPKFSTYIEKHNNMHLYPFDEYTLYGLDDVKDKLDDVNGLDKI